MLPALWLTVLSWWVETTVTSPKRAATSARTARRAGGKRSVEALALVFRELRAASGGAATTGGRAGGAGWTRLAVTAGPSAGCGRCVGGASTRRGGAGAKAVAAAGGSTGRGAGDAISPPVRTAGAASAVAGRAGRAAGTGALGLSTTAA